MPRTTRELPEINRLLTDKQPGISDVSFQVTSSIIDNNEIKYDSSEENIPVTTSNSTSHNVTIATTPTTLPVTSTIHSSASQEKSNNREEIVKRQLQNVTQERDDFRKEIEKLTSQISQLQKEVTFVLGVTGN